MQDFTDKKKVLFILESRFIHGKGTQRFLLEYGNYLVSHGYNVTLIENSAATLPDSPAPMNSEPLFNIVSTQFKKFLGIYFVPKDIILREDANILYVTNFNSMPFVPSCGVKTVFGSLILNISSLPFVTSRERFVFGIKKSMLRMIVRFFWNGKKIVFHVLNQDQEKWVKSITKNLFPVYLLPLPVNCDSLIQQNLTSMKKNEQFKVLYFGAFSEYRGFREFLHIVDALNSKTPDSNILFIAAGDGPLINLAEEHRKKYRNFILMRRPDDAAKKSIMAGADLFVYPSVIENFSIITAEAQVSGLPTVAADTAALRNIITGGITGNLIDPSVMTI